MALHATKQLANVIVHRVGLDLTVPKENVPKISMEKVVPRIANVKRKIRKLVILMMANVNVNLDGVVQLAIDHAHSLNMVNRVHYNAIAEIMLSARHSMENASVLLASPVTNVKVHVLKELMGKIVLSVVNAKMEPNVSQKLDNVFANQAGKALNANDLVK